MFDSLTIPNGGLGDGRTQAFTIDVGSPANVTLAPGGAALTPAGIIFGSTTSQILVGAMPLVPAGDTITTASIRVESTQTVWSTAHPVVNSSAASERSVVLGRTDDYPVRSLTRHRTGLVPDFVLDELTCDPVIVRESNAAVSIGVPVRPWHDFTGKTIPFDVLPGATDFQSASEIPAAETTAPQSDSAGQSPGFAARLAVILLAAGSYGYGAGGFAPRNMWRGRLQPKEAFSKMTPRSE